MRTKIRYPPGPGKLSRREKTILTGILKGRLARWGQMHLLVAETIDILKNELKELVLEGYAPKQLLEVWQSMKDSQFYYDGVKLIRSLAQTVGNTKKSTVNTSAALQTWGQFASYTRSLCSVLLPAPHYPHGRQGEERR